MEQFTEYFKMGWEHIVSLGALDHLLFIMALAAIYTLKDWKQVLILVTAFTIGHSTTLVLSVFNLVKVPSSWIEFLIPCTILITAAANLFHQKFSPKNFRFNYWLALFFGLIHGLGFANGLKSLLGKGESVVVPLLGFNLGVEVGQILVVMLLLLITWIVLNGLRFKRREWVLFLSGGAFISSLHMALERWP